MIFDYTDYRSYLKYELSLRAAKNANYSLRAFARKLKIAPSTLSEVLQAKRNISRELAQAIAVNLGLNEKETEYFYTLVEFNGTKNEELKSTLQARLRNLIPNTPPIEMDLEKVQKLTEWYCVPLLEMTNLNPPVESTQKMAELLGVTTAEVESTLNKLTQLGFLSKNARGYFEKTSRSFLMHSENPNQAIRHFHTQMLERAKLALTSQTNAEKFVGSETFAIDSRLLPEASEIIEECFAKLARLNEHSVLKDTVYHAGIQFFKMTKTRQEVKHETH